LIRDSIPRVISFDMNGTLTQDRFAQLVWGEGVPGLYSLTRKMPLEEAKERVFKEYEKVGEERVEWYDIRYWFGYFGLGEDWKAFLEGFRHEASPFPEAVHVLEELKEEHQLILTSNATREFIDVELGAAGLLGYFGQVFSSTSDFGQVKKTPDVYLKVCQAVGIQPREMVHVGDHRHFDFVVPRQLGITAFYLDRKGIETGEFIVGDLTEFCRRVLPG
jgi:HAD superfamily hydrolase (TIGR01549 family)